MALAVVIRVQGDGALYFATVRLKKHSMVAKSKPQIIAWNLPPPLRLCRL